MAFPKYVVLGIPPLPPTPPMHMASGDLASVEPSPCCVSPGSGLDTESSASWEPPGKESSSPRSVSNCDAGLMLGLGYLIYKTRVLNALMSEALTSGNTMCVRNTWISSQGCALSAAGSSPGSQLRCLLWLPGQTLGRPDDLGPP